MSYLWILLLFGGLLAGRANTQGEEVEAQTEEPAVATMALPENGEPLDLQDETVAEEALPESDSQPAEAEPHEEVTPAEGEAQPDAPSEAEPEPEVPAGEAQLGANVEEEPEPEPETTVEEEPEAAVEEEPATTVEEEPEAIVEVEEAEASPEGEATAAPELVPEPEPEAEPEGEAEVVTVQPTALPEAAKEPEPEAEVEPEPETTVESTWAPETDATTKFEAETDAPPHQDPAAVPEDPKPGQEDPDVAAQPTAIVHSSNPHQRHGFKDEGTVGEDAAATLDESADVDVDVDVNAGPELKPKAPSDGGSNLGDASSPGKAREAPAHSGRGKSVGSVAHVAEATGEGNDSEESGSGSLAAILCAVGVAVVGAVAGYFTYQKKKLCFKNLHDDDPEAARKADTTEAQSDPQVLSNLLNSS